MRFAPFMTICIVLAGCGDEECPPGTIDLGERCVVADASTDGSDACVGVDEVCNGEDDDCDGMADEGLAVSTYWADVDGDTHGDDASAVMACAPPPMHVSMGGDCNDGDDAINPGAPETCDGVDQDCDGAVDEGLVVPLGDPVVIAAAGAAAINGEVDIAGYEAGYAIAWVASGGRLRFVTTNSVGSPTRTEVEVDDSIATDQGNPSVAIVGSGGSARAVVVWNQGARLRMRVFPLDESPATDPIDVAMSTARVDRPEVVAVGDDAIVLWQDGDGATTRTWARAIDPATGTASTPPLELFQADDLIAFFSPRVGATGVDASTPFAVAATNMQLTGDLHEVIYVRRVFIGAGVLETDAEALRYDGTEGQDLIQPTPIAALPAAGGTVDVALAFTEDDGSTPRVRTDTLGVEPRTSPIATPNMPMDVMREGLVQDHVSVPGGAWTLTLMLDGALHFLPIALGGADGGDAIELVAASGTETRLTGASISAMRPSEGAVVYTRSDGSGGFEHAFRRIACE